MAGSCALASILVRLKHLPKPQSLIRRRRRHRRPVRAQGEVEDAARVAAELGYLFHVGVLPNTQLIIDEAVRGKDLLVVGVPLEGADLGVGMHTLHHLPLLRIPELNALIA